jgi:hypothetical protein
MTETRTRERRHWSCSNCNTFSSGDWRLELSFRLRPKTAGFRCNASDLHVAVLECVVTVGVEYLNICAHVFGLDIDCSVLGKGCSIFLVNGFADERKAAEITIISLVPSAKRHSTSFGILQ